jgi:hypothetical protein
MMTTSCRYFDELIKKHFGVEEKLDEFDERLVDYAQVHLVSRDGMRGYYFVGQLESERDYLRIRDETITTHELIRKKVIKEFEDGKNEMAGFYWERMGVAVR